ncbi:tRNA (guanine(10)-N2)-methyltransferase homolog [Halyomorpha halys]|uniref:tRNA (guanine(10)-N2)-methyltransferase homolog n=1 Tax=Halyomorpha halys TaxID=286706 RepID=UPI0006D4F574|nr:tRNA (guanine(10)-N2)-methyltransferase homolog [Halyomorpha halys]
MSSHLKKYLFWFANEHLDFRLNEIKSITTLLKVDLKWLKSPLEDPFWIAELDSDESATKIASRSVTVRYIIDLWSTAPSVSELHGELHGLSHSLVTPYRDVSFKMKVEIFGKSQTEKEKLDKIESFSYLPLNGRVKLKNPELALQYIEYYGVDHTTAPPHPRALYFGRVVASCQRELISKHSLKKRKFIGNTSMDPQLSLIMANQAKICVGDIVFDPFVGSGSLLIAAAEFGGYVLGTDIDYLMLHGKTRPTRKQDRHKPRSNESVLCNLKQYGLEDHYIDVIVADSSLPLWRPGILFDAIITDPPYGMREAIERVGCHKEDKKISEQHLPTHIPSKIVYPLSRLMSDLLNFAALYLKIGSRLVTWLPIIRCEYDEKKLPYHDCLQLVGNSEQILSTTSSRRLLTYEKIKNFKSSSCTNGILYDEETFRERYYKYVEQLRKAKADRKDN